ncbi:MAG: hypothetical protein J6B80_04390 [Clostridia bacterium]|nr:hypothetical protein [Clostridia bacterium]
MFKTLFFKKLKEFLIFAACLIVPLIPIILFIIFTFFSADLLSDSISFAGINNYLRMFANDTIFIKSLINTVITPVAISFLPVSIFALIIFLLKQKIKKPRLIFYIGGAFLGSVAAMAYTAYIQISIWFGIGANENAITTVLSHIGDYSPGIFSIITLPNIMAALYIGIFTALVFWVIECIVDIIRFLKRKNIKS